MTKTSRTNGLYEQVKDLLYYHDSVTKEGLAKRLGAREHEVANVLHMLNLEGFVHQPDHRSCPDPGMSEVKNGKFVKSNKCWHPDIYVSRVCVYRPEAGYTIFEVIVGIALLFGLALAIVVFCALLKYLEWCG